MSGYTDHAKGGGWRCTTRMQAKWPLTTLNGAGFKMTFSGSVTYGCAVAVGLLAVCGQKAELRTFRTDRRLFIMGLLGPLCPSFLTVLKVLRARNHTSHTSGLASCLHTEPSSHPNAAFVAALAASGPGGWFLLFTGGLQWCSGGEFRCKDSNRGQARSKYAGTLQEFRLVHLRIRSGTDCGVPCASRQEESLITRWRSSI